MTDFILQSDPLEFQNSRQSTKIMFLQQELQQLQDHIKDLEHIVRINKEALKIATGPQIQSTSKSKPLALSSDNTTADITDDRSSALQNLVNHLQEENVRLLDIIEKVKKERNVAQSKALISEQICEEAQRHEIETIAELEEKISDLRKLLQDKEYAIQELEKIKLVPEQEGVVIKFREVLNVTEQGIKLHNEIDALNGMLAKVSKEMNKLQAEKEHLQSINFGLTNELAKIKATFSSPLNVPTRLGLLGQVNSDVDLNNSDLQAGAFQAAIGFDENSPLPSPLPDKVLTTGADLPKAAVPKLDLSKAKKIQEQIAKKIAPVQPQPVNENYNMKAMEKINQLEDGLSLAKKRLSYEMINNKLLSDEISRLQKHVLQLVSTNELLIKSNRRYEEKWQKIFYTLEFYREFYHKYIDLITKGRTHMKTASTALPQYDKLIKMKDKFGANFDDPDKLIKGMRRMDEETGNAMGMSILEANDTEEKSIDSKQKTDNGTQASKEQCKIYLLNMAKDLHVNTNLSKTAIAKQMLKKLENKDESSYPKRIMKLKRSLSNPLEYVSERKKLIFDTEMDKKNRRELKPKQDEKLIDNPGDHFFDIEERDGVPDLNDLDKSPSQIIQKKNAKKGKFEHEGDEMISFTVDADEFNKNKLVEVSFISNDGILDQIKQE